MPSMWVILLKSADHSFLPSIWRNFRKFGLFWMRLINLFGLSTWTSFLVLILVDKLIWVTFVVYAWIYSSVLDLVCYHSNSFGFIILAFQLQVMIASSCCVYIPMILSLCLSKSSSPTTYSPAFLTCAFHLVIIF